MKKNNISKKSKISGGKIIAIGAGVAALGAGAYYLLGPNAKAHQKKVSTLMLKMKKEVEDEIKKAKNNVGPIYQKVVDTISTNYCKQYEEHEGEIKAFAKKLKSDWKNIPKFVNKTAKKAKRKLSNK